MIQTLERLLGDLKNTKIVSAILEEQAAFDRRARQKKLDELTAVQKEYAAVTEHDRIIAPLLKAERDEAAKHDIARQKLRDAERAKAATIASTRAREAAIVNELRRTADPQIAEAIRQVNARFDHERHTMNRQSEVMTGHRDEETLKPITAVIGNERAKARLLTAVRSARVALEQLQLENPDDLDAAIAAILAPVDTAWAQVDQLDPVPVTAA